MREQGNIIVSGIAGWYDLEENCPRHIRNINES